MFLRRFLLYVQCVRSLLGSEYGAGSSSERFTSYESSCYESSLMSC